MAKKHYSMRKIVASLAEGDWGSQFDSKEKAERAMIEKPNELTAAAMLELLNRFNKFIDAMADPPVQWWEKKIEKPKDAKKFPGLKIGDLLYTGDTDGGIGTSVIVQVDDDGCVVAVEANETSQSVAWRNYADESYWETPEAAMLAACESDLKYHSKYTKFAADFKAAADSGADLGGFLAGMDNQED